MSFVVVDPASRPAQFADPLGDKGDFHGVRRSGSVSAGARSPRAPSMSNPHLARCRGRSGCVT